MIASLTGIEGELVLVRICVEARLLEDLLEALAEAHRRGDFAVTICRPTFTYNEAWSPGIHSFGGQSYHLDRIRRGKPILLHGDGTSIWTATYRDDTASGFIGAVVGSLAFKWYRHRRKVVDFIDVTVSGMPLAWVFGRTGCSVVHAPTATGISRARTTLSQPPWPSIAPTGA